MGQRQCGGCGKWVADHLLNCPFCREPLPEIPSLPAHAYDTGAGSAYLRRGLLYMLLAGVFYYFAAGHSPLTFPFTVPPLATNYLLPLLFLSGFGLAAYGLYHRFLG